MGTVLLLQDEAHCVTPGPQYARTGVSTIEDVLGVRTRDIASILDSGAQTVCIGNIR